MKNERPINEVWVQKATLLAVQDFSPTGSGPCISHLEAVYLQEIQEGQTLPCQFQDTATPSRGQRHSLVLIHLNILMRYLGLKLKIPDELLFIRSSSLYLVKDRHHQSIRTDTHTQQVAWMWHHTGVLAGISMGLSVVRKLLKVQRLWQWLWP